MELAFYFLLYTKTTITQKSYKLFTVKQEKQDAIKLLAQIKLDSISDIILQAMQSGDILSIQFHKVFEEQEKYLKLTVNIRNQAKIKLKQKISEKNCLNKEEKKVSRIV